MRDRDRLFSRLSALEQGLDVITGTIRKADDKPAAGPWPDAATAPIVSSAPFTIAAPPTTPPAAITAALAPTEPERPPAPQPVRTEPTPVENSTPEPMPAPTPPSVIQAIPIPDPQASPRERGKSCGRNCRLRSPTLASILGQRIRSAGCGRCGAVSPSRTRRNSKACGRSLPCTSGGTVSACSCA